MQGLFITGTDTGVGKTFVTCHLARILRGLGYSVGIYKPACSGMDPVTQTWPDLECLEQALDHQFPRNWICPQVFRAPLAPPVAAAEEGRCVDSSLLRTGCDVWRNQVNFLLVEGVGGWKCPLTSSETIADLAADLGFPVLVVAANRLGMVSQTLLTLQSIRFSGLPIHATVVNDVIAEEDSSQLTNLDLLAGLTDVPIRGPLPRIGNTETALAEIEQILSELVLRRGELEQSPLKSL